MRILVKSSDAKLMEKLTYFAQESNIEYEKMRKGLKLRILGLTGRIPLALGIIAVKCDEGALLDVPLSVPEMEVLREVVKKYTGRDLGPGKWKLNMIKQINGFLTSEGIGFDKIELLEDDKNDDNSVQGKEEKSDSDGGKG